VVNLGVSKTTLFETLFGNNNRVKNLPAVEAEVTFIPKTEGGRATLPPLHLLDGHYRPHIVVGDIHQRQAVLIENEVQENYLGVQFQPTAEKLEFNKPFTAELLLIYYPHPIYEPLVPGATFTIREGAQIVGFGKVKRLLIGKTQI
jgi:hypothetical protein